MLALARRTVEVIKDKICNPWVTPIVLHTKLQNERNKPLSHLLIFNPKPYSNYIPVLLHCTIDIIIALRPFVLCIDFDTFVNEDTSLYEQGELDWQSRRGD